ncbi:unnamed protein product [Boreogadus saida]
MRTVKHKPFLAPVPPWTPIGPSAPCRPLGPLGPLEAPVSPVPPRGPCAHGPLGSRDRRHKGVFLTTLENEIGAVQCSLLTTDYFRSHRWAKGPFESLARSPSKRPEGKRRPSQLPYTGSSGEL